MAVWEATGRDDRESIVVRVSIHKRWSWRKPYMLQVKNNCAITVSRWGPLIRQRDVLAWEWLDGRIWTIEFHLSERCVTLLCDQQPVTRGGLDGSRQIRFDTEADVPPQSVVLDTCMNPRSTQGQRLARTKVGARHVQFVCPSSRASLAPIFVGGILYMYTRGGSAYS
jgi:hypothetical protein